jgi:ATP-dependent exoDNAse (exonuclease V) beta subunit
LADRLHAISQATVESFPVALAQASITIKTIEVSREADLGVDVESQSIGSAVMPTKLELEPALRIITGSRVKKSSSKVEAASETDTSNFAVFLEEEVESTLERKAGAEFGTIVHRCSQILHARAVPLPQVEEEALKIASQLCRGSDISIQAAASAAASINLHALVHEPGVEFEFPVLVSMQGGNHAGPYIGGGVVDIVIFAKDHTEIYDIKTDQVSAEGLSELARKYQGQLTLYASALERVGCPPVTIMGLLTTSVRDAENKATLVPVSRESK